jgi:hypothetical protein
MGLLEEATSPRGFAITTGRIPILLALKRVEDLKPHEETVEEDLNGMVRALQGEPTLRHPIIADSASGAVLDGTHRLAALKRLGCRTVPTALIDYQNPLVKIDRWYRVIKGFGLPDFLKLVERLSPIPTSAPEGDARLMARSSYATLRNMRQCYTFNPVHTGPLELCRSAFALERIGRDNHAKIAYSDNGEMRDFPESTILMSTIRLEKQEVVDSCTRHLLFPPKSTRHLIPSRPLGIGTPLAWLRDGDFERAEAEFEKHLGSMTVRRLPEGSKVGSRRYMEEVFLFE